MQEDDISIKQTVRTGDLTVMEASSPKYHDRTVANARWADLTIAFAVDFNTAGERLTRTAAGDRYLAVDVPTDRSKLTNSDANELTASLIAHNAASLHSFNLNIAGNGLETLRKNGLSQEDIDSFVAQVIGLAITKGMDVREIRSGGQSGADESGTKAAIMYGIEASQVVPRGFLYNDADGQPHWNKASFLARFEGIERRPLPQVKFDAGKAMQQAQGSGRSENVGFTLSQKSPVPGAIVGDILAAPYREVDADPERFEFFRPASSRGVNYHCGPTDVSRLTLAVTDWLVFGDKDNPDDLRRRFPEGREAGSSAIASALSVAGLYTDHLLQARELSRKGASAFGLRESDAKMCEAATMAVFMAAHGRDMHEIRFSMEEDYGIDLTAAMAGLTASRMLSEKKSVKDISAELLQSHAVVLVRDESQKRMEDGLSFYTLEEVLPRTMQMKTETFYVNGEEFSYEAPTHRRSHRVQDTLPIALASFLTSFTFDESVRKAILVGGDSPSIAAMAGALSAAYYGGISKEMASRCLLTLDSAQKDAISVFTKVSAPSRVKDYAQERVDLVTVYNIWGKKYAAMAHLDMHIGWALQMAGVEVIPVKELRTMLSEIKAKERNTPFDDLNGGTRMLYVTKDGLYSATEVNLPGMPSKELREKSRSVFENFADYCSDVRTMMEKIAGYDDHGGQQPHLKFPTACYPSRKGDTIYLYDHSMIDGSVELDSRTGLVKVNFSGELREGEYKDADWCREHILDSRSLVTFSLAEDLPRDWKRDMGMEGIRFGKEEMASLARLRKESGAYTLDLDGLKEAVARACLDQGVGMYDTHKQSNIERLHKDIVVMAEDARKQLQKGSDEHRGRGMKI